MCSWHRRSCSGHCCVSRVMCSLAQEIMEWSLLAPGDAFNEAHSQEEKSLGGSVDSPRSSLFCGMVFFSWVFDAICKEFGHPHVVVFAARANKTTIVKETLYPCLLWYLLVQSHIRKFHQGLEMLRLHTWKLSSTSSPRFTFQEKLWRPLLWASE